MFDNTLWKKGNGNATDKWHQKRGRRGRLTDGGRTQAKKVEVRSIAKEENTALPPPKKKVTPTKESLPLTAYPALALS